MGGGASQAEAWNQVNVEETCIREILEETGLDVQVTRLVGVNTSPDIMVEYPDGNRIQPVAFSFEAVVVGGELGLSDETTEVGYFAVNALHTIDLMEHRRQRVEDVTENRAAAFFRQKAEQPLLTNREPKLPQWS